MPQSGVASASVIFISIRFARPATATAHFSTHTHFGEGSPKFAVVFKFAGLVSCSRSVRPAISFAPCNMSVLVRRQQLRRPPSPNKLHSTPEFAGSGAPRRRAHARHCPLPKPAIASRLWRTTSSTCLPSRRTIVVVVVVARQCSGKFAKVRPAQWSASKGNQCRLSLPGCASTSANTAAAAGPTQRDLRTLARNRLPNERRRRSSKPEHLNPSRFLGPLFGAT